MKYIHLNFQLRFFINLFPACSTESGTHITYPEKNSVESYPSSPRSGMGRGDKNNGKRSLLVPNP